MLGRRDLGSKPRPGLGHVLEQDFVLLVGNKGCHRPALVGLLRALLAAEMLRMWGCHKVQ